jgi:transposase
MAKYRQSGERALAAKPHPGRSPKLPRQQQGLVLGWLRKNPRSFGFATELWTGRRVAQVIKRKFGVSYHPRYINEWLTGHNFSPQKPQKQARERNEQLIQHWLRHDWPRIQNAPASRMRIWS